jgi:drug/metabolite transporter (DMT)-like permease
MGELFALAAAVVWACAVILFKRSGESVPPFALNVFRVTVSLVVFLPLTALLGQPLWGQAPLRDYLILFASGIVGIAVSDTFFHASLNRIGAGLSGIVDCLYSPSVVVMAFLLLRERIGAWQLAGMTLVIGGVLVAARHRPPPGTTVRELLGGIALGALAMITLALGIVIAKPVLERTPVVWATTMRQIGTFAVMLPAVLVMPSRRTVLAVFRPAASWRYTLTGTVCGSVLALLFWIAGMKYAQAGVAAIVNQSTTIIILLFASLFLKEPFTRRKLVAAGMTVTGILMVTQL